MTGHIQKYGKSKLYVEGNVLNLSVMLSTEGGKAVWNLPSLLYGVVMQDDGISLEKLVFVS